MKLGQSVKMTIDKRRAKHNVRQAEAGRAKANKPGIECVFYKPTVRKLEKGTRRK